MPRLRKPFRIPSPVSRHARIFRMCQSTQSGNPPTPMYPFMAHPQFARLYLQEMNRLLDGPFSAAQFNPLADEILGPVWDSAGIQAVKDFNAARTASVSAGVSARGDGGRGAATTGATTGWRRR